MIRLTVESSATEGVEPLMAWGDSPLGQLFASLPHLKAAVLQYDGHETTYRREVDDA